MRERDIPLDESKSFLSTFFGSEYVPVFESEEGYLKPDLENKEEEFQDVLYKVIEKDENFELARGSAGGLRYLISIESDGESSPYAIEVVVNSLLSDNDFSRAMEILGKDIENYMNAQEMEEAERKFQMKFTEELSDVWNGKGIINCARPSYMSYTRLLSEEDMNNPEEALEKAGEMVSESFKYYRDFLDDLNRLSRRDGVEKRN